MTIFPLHYSKANFMKSYILLLVTVLLTNSVWSQSNKELQSILKNLKVELIQPGVISTSGFEFGTSISPDGEEFFFVKGITGFRRTAIVYSIWQDSRWSSPKLAPFSGKYNDTNPYFSKDGKRLYFTSDRPTLILKYARTNLWYVDKIQGGWTSPKLIEDIINDQYEIVYPTIQMNGTIHFVSWSRPGSEKGDIFKSQLVGGSYTKPELVDELNSPMSDADPEISQNGEFMFITSQRNGGLGHYDLYIFKKLKNGKWGKAINLGSKVNSIYMDSDPILSPDGNTLYFSSDRIEVDNRLSNPHTSYEMLVKSNEGIYNGLMNIYKVDISRLLEYLKNETKTN